MDQQPYRPTVLVIAALLGLASPPWACSDPEPPPAKPKNNQTNNQSNNQINNQSNNQTNNQTNNTSNNQKNNQINNDPGPCQIKPLDRQPTARFVRGQTFYLPTIVGGGCSPSDWTLTQAPEGQREALVFGDDHARFTPVTPGLYTFTLREHVQTLQVVEFEASQHMNYNYYPTRSIARVGEEVWVTNVYSPTISRLKPDDLTELGQPIATGAWPVALAWREGMEVVVVAQRGEDTLGLIDRTSGRLVDAIWVGDEPTNVVVSPGGDRAYVTLVSGELVAVDLARRAVAARAQVVEDASGLAISPDGQTLYVASYRSGHALRFPYEDTDPQQQRDIAVVQAADLTLRRHFIDVGTTLRALEVSEDGSTLYVANTRNDEAAKNLTDRSALTFVYEVLALDAVSGQVKQRADLTRQPSSTGPAVHVAALALTADRIWVVAEASDALIGLDRATLQEQVRLEAPGRPRGLVVDDQALYVHGAQRFTITRWPLQAPDQAHDQAKRATLKVQDPRDPAARDGQLYFTGAGQGYASNWTCNTCHQDGLMDKVIWNAGPLTNRIVTRPFFWLEGTYPLGWAGYLSGVRNYAFTVNTNVGVRPDTKLVQDLTAYMASIMPPPAANSLTERDGALSAQAQRGQALFEGKAGCAGCHGLPLTTSRQVLPQGITEGLTDIPALVGAYRHGVWLKLGQAQTLRQATVEMLKWLQNDQLSEDEIDDVTRYMQELTGRDLFVLTPQPREGQQAVGVDEVVEVVFSQVLHQAPENLARVSLTSAQGEVVQTSRELLQGRRLRLRPQAPLRHDTTYAITIDEALESFGQVKLVGKRRFEFTTAKAPSLELRGDYEWVVHMPSFNPAMGGFDPANTTEIVVSLEAKPTPSGALFQMDYQQGLALEARVTLSQDQLFSEPLPVPIGPSFADTTGIQAAQVKDADGDGELDEASGRLSMSGPGFVLPDIAWELRRPNLAQCPEGATGQAMIMVSVDAAGLATLELPQGARALAVYITDPGATIPMGPGPVTQGQTYLALSAASFQEGFAGPITMGSLPAGAVDVTPMNGGMPLGTPLSPGGCYKAFVLLAGFQSGQVIFRVPNP